MTWTTSKPTEAGWYFVRRHGAERVRLVTIGRPTVDQPGGSDAMLCLESAPCQPARIVEMPGEGWEWSPRIVWPREVRMGK